MKYNYSFNDWGDNTLRVYIPKSINEESNFLKQLIIEKQDRILNEMPFAFLQEMEHSIIEAGEYYTQKNNDGSTISVHVSEHSVSFATKTITDDCEIFKRLYYDYYKKVVSFRWTKNDKDGSSYYQKLYKNTRTPIKSENQIMSEEDLKEGIKEIFNEVKKFQGIAFIINISMIEECVHKYLGGISR